MQQTPKTPFRMVSKSDFVKIVGAITFLFAVSPIIYTRFDNVANTGNKFEDEAAEALHDAVFGMMTVPLTVSVAITFYAIFRIVMFFVPDRLFTVKENIA